MPALRARLFGKFSVLRDGQEVKGFDSRRVQELFCYLLIFRDRPHPRETLASLLWEASSTAQSKKYLRQAIWQLQSSLGTEGESVAHQTLQIEPDWIRINPEADLWIDVAVFEQAFSTVQGLPGQELNPLQAQTLEAAVELYQGDLLEGWYQDWCLYERERLQNMWLAMLDKLMAYCEANQTFEAGLVYGMRTLRADRARERTHRRLMRLYYLAGDRTAAIRQYARCSTALEQELSVKPAKRTQALYEQILADELEPATYAKRPTPHEPSTPVPNLIARLNQLHEILANVQRHVIQDLEAIERALEEPQ